jgi:hypothetical protein
MNHHNKFLAEAIILLMNCHVTAEPTPNLRKIYQRIQMKCHIHSFLRKGKFTRIMDCKIDLLSIPPEIEEENFVSTLCGICKEE